MDRGIKMSYKEKLKIARKWAKDNGGVLRKHTYTIAGSPCFYVDTGEYYSKDEKLKNWSLGSIVNDSLDSTEDLKHSIPDYLKIPDFDFSIRAKNG